MKKLLGSLVVAASLLTSGLACAEVSVSVDLPAVVIERHPRLEYRERLGQVDREHAYERNQRRFEYRQRLYELEIARQKRIREHRTYYHERLQIWQESHPRR